jgi:hypothetical protein
MTAHTAVSFFFSSSFRLFYFVTLDPLFALLFVLF